MVKLLLDRGGQIDAKTRVSVCASRLRVGTCVFFPQGRPPSPRKWVSLGNGSLGFYSVAGPS